MNNDSLPGYVQVFYANREDYLSWLECNALMWTMTFDFEGALESD